MTATTEVVYAPHVTEGMREVMSPERGYGPVPEFAAFAAHPAFKGLFVGGCVEHGIGSRFRAMAHAHNTPGGEYQGWICVLSPRRVLTRSGGPSQLMLHELAHLLTPGRGHDDKWRAVARSLGYRLPAHYRKQVRA